ncbi:MAG: hypothetical protein ACQEP5_07340 [Actinomycetota bacterium]
MPWWAWLLIIIAALAVIVPIKVVVLKKMLGKKAFREQESKEDF